eukprot:scaffold1328_cov162-Amphora_coffeaeformis.AAC.13
MVKVENEAFDEIFYCQPVGAGRDTYRRQFVCAPHQEFVCGTCCMDFALLNDLRYDNEYLLLASVPHQRMERIRRVVDYYYMNPRAEFRRDPTKRKSPRLAKLLMLFSGNTGVSVGKVIELAAYLSYICRSDAASRQRICTTLDTVLLEDLYAASKNHTLEEGETFNSSDDSIDGIPAPTPKALVLKPRPEPKKKTTSTQPIQPPRKADGTAKKVLSVQIQNLVEQYAVVFKRCKNMLRREGVKSFGNFFEDFKNVLSEGDEEAWTRFLRKRAKTGVAAADLDPQDWPASQVRKFLDQHGLSLYPRPSKEAMAETARQVLHFSVACKNILYHYSIVKSDDRKENALVSRDSNRRRNSPERENSPIKVAVLPVSQVKVSQPNTKCDKPCFLVEPQIPLGMRLSSMPTWEMLGKFVKCHPFFVRNRMAYVKAFPSDSVFHRVLDLLELMADTHDRTLESHPPQDFLVVLTSKTNEGRETSLAIRSLGAHNVGTSSEVPVPVLNVEFLAAEHVPSSNSYQMMSKGIRPGATRFINEKCEKKDLDLLILILQTNRKQLPVGDVEHNFSAALSPGWNFSVLRPADPIRRAAFPLCPLCDQSASMVCSLCREVSYCSRKCQVADWKKHYQVCKACDNNHE